MKQDLKLAHDILKHVEKGRDPRDLTPGQGHAPRVIEEHIRLLIHHGLLTGEKDAKAMAGRLTGKGRRFLAALKDAKVQEKIRKKAEHVGESVTVEIALDIVKDALIELL